MNESPYLKDELGPILAKGLAEVAVARPQDPVEFLGLWLLHQLQKAEAQAAEQRKAVAVETQREEWARGRGAREKEASAVIQREWRAHVHGQQEAKLRDAELKEKFAEIADVAEEQVPEEEPLDADGPEAERAVEAERLAATAQFGRERLYVAELTKAYVADFKKFPGDNHSITTTLKCVLYLMGHSPKEVATWEQIRVLIKPYGFAQFLTQFHPITTGQELTKKRVMSRVRRLLTTIHADNVKEHGAAINAVYNWLAAASQFREARDEYLRQQRAAGKEPEEELEEDDEEAENEERYKDEDEETVRKAEIEAKRQAELEAAEEAEEGVEEEA